jgi:Phosphotransferase enzyme family
VSAAESDCIAWGEQHLRDTGVAGSFVTTMVKRRAWSTVWTLESASGRFYLKEAAPGFDVEAPLLEILCSWRPASIVEIVATDATHGWMLTRNAGRMLHDVMFDDPEAGRAHFRAILMAYARLQVDCLRRDAPPFADVLEDRRPAAIARLFAAVVSDDALLRAGGATSDDLIQRGRWLRRVDQLCGDLAALDLPLTLEHGDLHTSNIMIAADGRARIADWGDACWATPFHGLALCLDDVAGRHKMARDDPWFAQLVEDYFDIWWRGGTSGEFYQALELVRALAPVSGVLRWSRGIDRMAADGRLIMAGHIVKHMRALG